MPLLVVLIFSKRIKLSLVNVFLGWYFNELTFDRLTQHILGWVIISEFQWFYVTPATPFTIATKASSNWGGRIAQWIAFLLRIQWPRVRFS